MFHGTSEIDAGFYRLIHEMVGPDLKDEPAERRAAVRHAFPTMQRIAPRRGPGFPEDREFAEVRCYDLTQAGFAFFLPVEPDFTSLVAAFGDPPHLIYVGAEIVRAKRVLLLPSGRVEQIGAGAGTTGGENGKIVFLVGARFTAKLDRPMPGTP